MIKLTLPAFLLPGQLAPPAPSSMRSFFYRTHPHPTWPGRPPATNPLSWELAVATAPAPWAQCLHHWVGLSVQRQRSKESAKESRRQVAKSEGSSICILKSQRIHVGELSEREKVSQDSRSETKVERSPGGQYKMGTWRCRGE